MDGGRPTSVVIVNGDECFEIDVVDQP